MKQLLTLLLVLMTLEMFPQCAPHMSSIDLGVITNRSVPVGLGAGYALTPQDAQFGIAGGLYGGGHATVPGKEVMRGFNIGVQAYGSMRLTTPGSGFTILGTVGGSADNMGMGAYLGIQTVHYITDWRALYIAPSYDVLRGYYQLRIGIYLPTHKL